MDLWFQGFVIILLGLWAHKQRLLGWWILLAIMAIYGLFLGSLTFPSENVTYLKNGVEVSAEEFTVFKDTQWTYVFVNVLALLIGYVLVKLTKKDDGAYSGAQVVKRLIPLHITIILAGFISWSVLLFLVLKSVFDVLVEYVATVIQHNKQV